MKKEIIPIFFPTDSNYVPILHVALQSLVSQASKKYNYHLHILGESLTEEEITSFSVHNKDNFKVFHTNMTEIIAKHESKMNIKYYYSKAIYFRTFIPNLFPEYKKVIYLDSDIAFNADVSELFSFDLGDNYVGAVTCETVNTSAVFTNYAEKFLGMKLPYYFNSGVMILNCEKLREVSFEERFYDVMGKIKLELCPDQDCYNILCQGKTLFLPKVWNKIPREGSTEKLEDVKLVHYNLSLKPWRYDNILYGELFWKHAKNTPAAIYETLLEMKTKLFKEMQLRDKARMVGMMRLATWKSLSIKSINKQILSGKLVLIASEDPSFMEAVKVMVDRIKKSKLKNSRSSKKALTHA